MKAENTVFLTEDQKTAVGEGDPKARFLLIRAGREIPEASYKDIPGAAELIEGKSKKKEEEPKKAAKH